MDFLIFIVNFLFSFFYILLALRAILPWIPHSRTNPFLIPLYRVMEPVLTVLRQGFPPSWMGMDVSPFVMIILVWILHQVLLMLLSGF